MTSFVLDASALLALLQGEPGSDVVSTALASRAAMSAVNLSEVVAKLGDAGMGEADIHAALDLLGITIIDITADLANVAGLLRPLARAIGLSLGDRFCLALAKQLNLPALTADRSWAALAPRHQRYRYPLIPLLADAPYRLRRPPAFATRASLHP